MQRRLAVLLMAAALAACGDNPVEPVVQAAPNANAGNSQATPANPSFIVVLRAGENPGAVARAHGVVPTFVYSKALNGFAGSVSELARAGLLRDARVQQVVQDEEATISDVQSGVTWGL